MSNLVLRADHSQLRQIRPWLDAEATPLDAAVVGRIELCLQELAANVIDHSGATEFSVRLAREPHQLVIEVHDHGAPVRSAESSGLEPHPRVRGYGMMIAEQLASELSYERRDGMNIWRTAFDLTA